MKEIIIIDTFIRDETDKFLLIDCIQKLKRLNKDICVISHSPLEDYISRSVNYCIYDSVNEFSEDPLHVWIWRPSPGYFLKYYYNNHTLPIMRSLNLVFNFVRNLGYDHFYFTEYDNAFSKFDLDKFDDIREFSQDSLFLLKYDSSKHEEKGYYTTFFAGNIEYFLNHFQLPQTKEQWTTLGYGGLFEHILYDKLNKFENEICVVESTVQNYFPNSQIDMSGASPKVRVLYNTTDKNKPMLLITDPTIEGTNYTVIEDHHDIETKHTKHIVSKDNPLLLPVAFKNGDLHIQVYNESRRIYQESFHSSKQLKKIGEYTEL